MSPEMLVVGGRTAPQNASAPVFRFLPTSNPNVRFFCPKCGRVGPGITEEAAETALMWCSKSPEGYEHKPTPMKRKEAA